MNNTEKKNAAATIENKKEEKNMNVLAVLRSKISKQENVVKSVRDEWRTAVYTQRSIQAKGEAAKKAGATKNVLAFLKDQWRSAKYTERRAAAKGVMARNILDELKKEYDKVNTPDTLVNDRKKEEAEIKAKYAGLRKDLEERLEREYQEELAALKAKFVAKKKEELKALIACYEMEIASIGHETVVVPASVQKEKPVAPPVPAAKDIIEAPDYNGKKTILIAGSIFKSGSGNCYAVNTQFNRAEYLAADPKGKQKMINTALMNGDIVKVEKQAENLLFPCDMYVEEEPKEEMITVEVEAEIIEEAAALPAVVEPPVSVIPPVVSKKEHTMDGVAKEAMAYDGQVSLDMGEIFSDDDGRTYEVTFSFEIAVYLDSPVAIRRKMIKKAIEDGDIKEIAA